MQMELSIKNWGFLVQVHGLTSRFDVEEGVCAAVLRRARK
jgi:hypothetical protein